jgi:hypothetical protein
MKKNGIKSRFMHRIAWGIRSLAARGALPWQRQMRGSPADKARETRLHRESYVAPYDEIKGKRGGPTWSSKVFNARAQLEQSTRNAETR